MITDLIRIKSVKPARRHKCELCNDIYICHLCTIGADHGLHANVDKTKLKVPTFVYLKHKQPRTWKEVNKKCQ